MIEALHLDTVSVLKKKSTTNKLHTDNNSIRVRKVLPKDVDTIYSIACSVGTKNKDSTQGFLMDNYTSSPNKYKKFFLKKIEELDYFYIAQSHKPLGFLMAYTKNQWLKDNPNWIQDIYWSPDFNQNKTNNFIVIDKTAILAGYTGKGIGSRLYKRLIVDIAKAGITNIFAETIISPTPNLASLAFRKKQKYTLAGVRYEKYEKKLYTDLIYYKSVDKVKLQGTM
ncbi:GNAT family N-acetyltransferase [Paramaledivibacter caminithermalis]|jgi:predicted GNAT superfamily acetyltransferase|uniref:Acetyltransferase (GNAT) family protein n=1 Tax=Paramaledivibacter caminithermalis (strain DSM 15212 / CIP 107654 / DViRD3) TaxID=1121301 RepID=A0A1M6QCF8_PARC5|nr:GNAT family N-acetyltransferase [Paramaledivibacter caminithermalis]SHK17984.1 Acetyltransferase (GNAT) family protein [Paramaledivibacter caminithermalis DSM 15212]